MRGRGTQKERDHSWIQVSETLKRVGSSVQLELLVFGIGDSTSSSPGENKGRLNAETNKQMAGGVLNSWGFSTHLLFKKLYYWGLVDSQCVTLVSGVQQSESIIHKQVSTPFKTSFPICMIAYECQSQPSIHPAPQPAFFMEIKVISPAERRSRCWDTGLKEC